MCWKTSFARAVLSSPSPTIFNSLANASAETGNDSSEISRSFNDRSTSCWIQLLALRVTTRLCDGLKIVDQRASLIDEYFGIVRVKLILAV